MKNGIVVPLKLKIELPSDPATPLLGIYPKDLKAETWRNICTPLYIAALFTIAERWKQHKHPLTYEWLNKLWHIHTMKYYSVFKRKRSLKHATTWMKLEGLTLSEMHQLQKNKINATWSHLWNHKIHQNRKVKWCSPGMEEWKSEGITA